MWLRQLEPQFERLFDFGDGAALDFAAKHCAFDKVHADRHVDLHAVGDARVLCDAPARLDAKIVAVRDVDEQRNDVDAQLLVREKVALRFSAACGVWSDGGFHRRTIVELAYAQAVDHAPVVDLQLCVASCRAILSEQRRAIGKKQTKKLYGVDVLDNCRRNHCLA